MKCLLSLVILGCFNIIYGQVWTPPVLPTPDPACPAPDCNLPSNQEILFPISDSRFYWQCGGNGAGIFLFTLECPPFQFFSFLNQRCDFIDQFIPTCASDATITPPPVTQPPVTQPSVTQPPVTQPVTELPTTSLVITTTSQSITTPPPNNNCPCQCPCMPWFPCNPCQSNCACSG